MSEVMKTCEIAEYQPILAMLHELKQRIGNKVYDVSTKDGMAEAKADRRDSRTVRVNLEQMRKDMKEPALRRCQKLDSEARVLTAEFLALESRPDAAIKEWEAREAAKKAEKERIERARVEQIHEAIRNIETLPMTAIGKSAADIAGISNRLTMEFKLPSFGEFEKQAIAAYDATHSKLEQMHKDAIAAAEEQARLAAERAAFEEQQKQERAAAAEAEAARRQQAAEEEARLAAERAAFEEQQKQERAAAAEAEAARRQQAAEEEARLADERRVLAEQQDALRQQQEAEKSERERVAAEQEAERQRISQEQAAIEAQKAEIAAAQVNSESLATTGKDIRDDMGVIYSIASAHTFDGDGGAQYSPLKRIADIAGRWTEGWDREVGA